MTDIILKEIDQKAKDYLKYCLEKPLPKVTFGGLFRYIKNVYAQYGYK